MITGQPTSATNSARSSSCSFSIAACSWPRHRLRSSRLVAQSVVSKARRAASTARAMSARDASVVVPSTSSVAGLMLSNSAPDSASTSFPSISMRCSPMASDTTVTLMTATSTNGGADTVAHLVLSRAGDDTVGVRFEDRQWTWRQVVEEASARAALLTSLRADGPFHIGVLLENTPEYLFLLAGAALAGAVVVGINPTRRGAELERDVRHTDCQLIVTETAQAG